jgi:shikimate dehydrogenase
MPSPSDPVLTLRDLECWTRPEASLAVLGHPIKHSISPPMHNAALAELARSDPSFATWKYFRFEIHPDDLPLALRLLHAKKFRGVNLTVPHKIIAIDHVQEIDPAARLVGAVNTLRWTEAGWHGYNTDGYGLAGGVHETLGRDLAGTAIVLLGAGGAARGAAVECLQRRCTSLWIANRTADNLNALLNALRPLAGKIPLQGFSPANLPPNLPASGVVINATSVGLGAADAAPIALAALPRPVAVYDMIYNPPQTALLREAVALGIPAANGLSMLVHQGAKSLEIWSGVPAARTVPAMSAAVRRALGLG